MNKPETSVSIDDILYKIEISIYSEDLNEIKTLFLKLFHLSSYILNNGYKIANLLFLACKSNRVDIVEYFLSDVVVKFIITINKLFFCPEDKDIYYHNIFYYSIRNSNVRLVDCLIREWPENYLKLHPDKLNNLLSYPYYELLLNNVFLTHEIQIFIESQLLDIRFNKLNTNISIKNHDYIKKHICYLIADIKNVLKSTEVDEKCLFSIICVAKDIYILKRLLKCTYDKIPWEEMEFCLSCFISCYKTIEELNIFYKYYFSFQKIQTYLKYFLTKIENLLSSVGCFDLKTIGILPVKSQRETVAESTESESLIKDHQIIRDIYSLEKITEALILAVSVDAKTREGQLVIYRSLQITGENLKNTMEAPKLSNKTADFLLLYLPHRTKKIIMELRNSLSHSYSFKKRLELEEDPNYFFKLQKDLKKVMVIVQEILLTKKDNIIFEIVAKLSQVSCIAELEQLLEILKASNINNLYQTIERFGKESFFDDEKLLDLIEKLDNLISTKTDYEKKLFSDAYEIIKINSSNFFKKKQAYLLKILHLMSIKNAFIDMEINKDTLEVIKNIAYVIRRNSIPILKLEDDLICENSLFIHLWKDSLSLQNIVSNIFESASVRIGDDDLQNALALKNEIFDISLLDKVIVEELDEVWGKIGKRSKTEAKIDLSMLRKSILIELERIFMQRGINFKNGIKIPLESDVKKLQIFKSVTETLFLDLMSILESTDNLSSNSSSVDDKPFIMFGKDLRNHLAHGNVLFDVLTNLDSLNIVIMNAVKYLKSEQQKPIVEVPIKIIDFSSPDNCNEDSSIVINKCNLFLSLERGNLENVKLLVQKGADILSRDYNCNNCLHYASKATSEVIHYLLEQNTWTNFKNINGHLPLHIAAKLGKNDAIKLLLENGFCVNEIVSGKSALHFAAMNGHSDTVELLLKNHAISSIKDKEGFMPLHYAVKYNCLDVLSKLLQNEHEINSSLSDSSYSLLHIASQHGHCNLVNFFISKKANVNLKSDMDQTPLHIAAMESHLDVVEALISNGANVNALSVSNSTPLLYACEAGNIEIVKLLLQKGAHIDALDSHNMSPLYCASKNGHFEVVDMLLKKGANVNVRFLNDIVPLNENVGVKVTPFLEAVFRGHVEVVKKFVEVVKHKFDINAVVDNCTAMHLAAMGDSEELISLLLENKASVADRTKTGFTPLHIASRVGNCKIIEILLKNGADIDAKDVNESTPLHEAVSSDQSAAVALLIKNKAEINVLNKSYTSPLHLAVYNRSEELVELLLKHGADVDIGISQSAFSPLHFACMYGLNNIVDILLKNGASLEINETLGLNALKITIQGGHLAIIKTALNNKINLSSDNLEEIILESVRNNRRNILELFLNSIKRIEIIPMLPKILSLSILLGFNGISKFIFNKFKIEVLNLIKKFADMSNHMANDNIKNASLNYSNSQSYLNSSPYFKYNETNLKLLHIACLKGNNEMVKFLLSNKFLVNDVSFEGTTPLHLAVLHNKLELVSSLVQSGAIVNAANVNKWTPLHMTVSEGNLNLLSFLVDNGADINAKTNDGFKPVHIATANGHHKIVEYFLKSGFDIEESGPLNQNLIHIAAARGQMSVLKLLIKIKCDLNVKDIDGYSPVHLATINGHRNVLEYLVNAGSIFNSVDKYSRTPLDYSTNEEIRIILKTTQAFFRSVKQNLNDVRIGLKKGALINAIDSNSASALHYAAWKGFHNVVSILLNNKCNLNVVGKNGFTPLHYAAEFHQYQVVILILSNGAMYNILSNTQKTPLDLAKDKKIVDLLEYVSNCFTKIEQGDIAVIDLLKQSNNDYTQVIWKTRNTDNKNIISLAVESNFSEIKELKNLVLRDFSCDIINAKRLRFMNHFDEALELYKQILNSKNEFLDSNDPDIISLEIAIAELLREKEEFSSSLKLYQSIYEKLQPIRSEDHKELLGCRIEIGVTMYKLGKYDTSLAILKDVYQIQRANFKVNFPSILKTMLNIVYVLTEIGKFEEALEINNNIIAWGPEQPIIFNAKCSLAKVLSGLGRCDEAYEIYKEVFEVYRRMLGPCHSSTLKLLHNIAVLYPKEKKSESLKLLFDVLKAQKNNSPNHDVYITFFNIATVLLEDGNLFRSLQFFIECYEIGLCIFHKEHPEMLRLETKIEAMKLNFICEGCSIEKVLEKINDNLFAAVKKEDINYLKGLIVKGVGIDERDREGRTLLHYAVSNGSIEIINTLLEHGANVTLSTNKGNNLLHIAALNNRFDLMEIILAHISESKKYSFVNSKTKVSGKTPLHVAAEKGFLNSVSCLMNHGSTHNICDVNGKTPLDLAKDKKVKHLIHFFIGFNSQK